MVFVSEHGCGRLQGLTADLVEGVQLVAVLSLLAGSAVGAPLLESAKKLADYPALLNPKWQSLIGV
jgi:hypothetical protein